ncbi:hypothetical protein BDEG_28715 [Batrachochytrium dendrobatidis JEL423]|uniref:Uncharacterized protein n=1 Tax=Batrachochytrium dendrobatidis (strain JEL423) TaxID=403673 RepID=A0A177VZ71_BATDL|nr:hypothetical protein BDEG_28715 [Batrachochytrium dendrobatidis JEL423]
MITTVCTPDLKLGYSIQRSSQSLYPRIRRLPTTKAYNQLAKVLKEGGAPAGQPSHGCEFTKEEITRPIPLGCGREFNRPEGPLPLAKLHQSPTQVDIFYNR